MIYNEIRRKTPEVRVGSVGIGGSAPIAIQSMTNVDPHNFSALKAQLQALFDAGCDIVRLTVPDLEAAEVFGQLKAVFPTKPLVADIHFDYRLAIAVAKRGADKIRINPGNIGDPDRVRAVCRECAERGIPIRIGVNGGSLEKEILAKYGAATPRALVESALQHIKLLEQANFHDIIVSIKASDVQGMIAANRLLAKEMPYPIHLGVTEAGGGDIAAIKSAIGIGSLLSDGIGDTIRVSLTDDPVAEVAAARNILQALRVQGQCGMHIVSCPTCGRTKIDLIDLSERFRAAAAEQRLLDLPIHVALMGCPVNGPGEARDADVGICGGDGEALLIKKGVVVGKLPQEEIIPRLLDEIRQMK